MVGWSSNNFFTVWTCHCPPWSSFEVGQGCELPRLPGPLVYCTIPASGCRAELSSCPTVSTGAQCTEHRDWAGPSSQRLSMASSCSLERIICKNKLLKEWFPPSCLPVLLFIPVLWLFFDFLLYCLFEGAASCVTMSSFFSEMSQCAPSDPGESPEPYWSACQWILWLFNFLIKSGFSFPIFMLDLQAGKKISTECYHCFVSFFNHSKKRQSFLLVQVFSSFTSDYWMRNLKKNLFNFVTDMEGNVPRYLSAGLLY